MLDYKWNPDNDQGVWLQDLPANLSGLTCFVTDQPTSNTPIHTDLQTSFTEGVFDIPKVGSKPAQAAVPCYKAEFAGSAITARLTVDTFYYVVSRYGTHYRSVFKIKVTAPREAVNK